MWLHLSNIGGLIILKTATVNTVDNTLPNEYIKYEQPNWTSRRIIAHIFTKMALEDLYFLQNEAPKTQADNKSVGSNSAAYSDNREYDNNLAAT